MFFIPDFKSESVAKSEKQVTKICFVESYSIHKGVVARYAFKLEFSELHSYFFLFNGLNNIYRAYIYFLYFNIKT